MHRTYSLRSISFINLNSTREWMIQLLESLEYLHKQGFIHRCITLDSVQVHQPEAMGSTTVKLSNTAYAYTIIDMVYHFPNLSRYDDIDLFPFDANGWIAPERLNPKNNRVFLKPQRKTDVWDLGVICLQMLLGTDIIYEFQSPIDFLTSCSGLDDAIYTFLHSIFELKTKKRPDPLELLPYKFLRLNLNISPLVNLMKQPESKFLGNQGFPDRSSLFCSFSTSF